MNRRTPNRPREGQARQAIAASQYEAPPRRRSPPSPAPGRASGAPPRRRIRMNGPVPLSPPLPDSTRGPDVVPLDRRDAAACLLLVAVVVAFVWPRADALVCGE